MSNVEDGNVNAIDEDTIPDRGIPLVIPNRASPVPLVIYDAVVADVGDPDVEPTVKDKRTRSQRQHATRKAIKAAEQALANAENPFASE